MMEPPVAPERGRATQAPSDLPPPSSGAAVSLGRALLERALLADNPEADDDLRAVLDAQVGDARSALLAALDEGALIGTVAFTARLSVAEAEVLAALLAVELDPEVQTLAGLLAGDPTRTRLTLHGLRVLFPAPHQGTLAVAADARLRRACLVDVEEAGPWATRTVSVPGPATWTFAGDLSLDPDLPARTRMVDVDEPGAPTPGLLLVWGGDPERRRRVARARMDAAAALLGPCPDSGAGWRALVREATLAGAVVVLEVGDELPGDACAWIERANHLPWVISSAVELPLESLPDMVWDEVALEGAAEPPDDGDGTGGVGSPAPFDLDLEQLRLLSRSPYGRGGDVPAAVRRLAGGHLDRVTTRIRPARTWADLVLPPAQTGLVRELLARYRHRHTVYGDWSFKAASRGVVALFSGPSGTGKTLTAEIVAGELGLDLFTLDLSSIVSKYVGETEKNLEAVFRAAETGDVVLFFDEADSLLGRRSDISSSHDRYANIEVSYLLQRLERHDGMVLLATNLAKNIDPAFVRRIHVSVEFPIPKEPERRAIWALSFPPGCPTRELDLDWLAANFEIAGGAIRNAATTAAFLAADRDEAVTMELVVAGLRREFEKIGRLVTEADFGAWAGGAL